MLSQINVFSQNINKDIRQGIKLYKDSSYVEAEQKFRNALQKNQDSFVSSFNLADAIYKQENYEQSESLFEALTEKAKTKEFFELIPSKSLKKEIFSRQKWRRKRPLKNMAFSYKSQIFNFKIQKSVLQKRCEIIRLNVHIFWYTHVKSLLE